MRNSVRLLLGSIVLASLALAGCSSSDDDDGDGEARVRLLNASPDYDSLDFYAMRSGQDSENLLFSKVAYGTLSEYAGLSAGDYTFKFRRSGVSSTLRTISDQLGGDAYGVYLAFGSTGRFSVLEVLENYGQPDAGRTWLQAFNAAEAGTLDIYLTESSVSLEDATPTFSALTAGGSATGVTVDSGEYRLRVTGSNNKSDLRLDVPNITLDSRGVGALILTSTKGGVLVGGMFLPQRGDLATHANTKARVRGAVGIANGNVATLRVGNVGLLTNAAPGVVGQYAQVNAGSASITLMVDGVPATAPNETLVAGGDYTLAAWSDASGARASLIEDNNRLPSSGKAKLRIVNLLSTHGVPVNLAVDFSPIAEGVALGAASDYTELDGSLEYQLDVSDANTGAHLYTRTEVSLQTGGVYTLFLSGSGGAVNGTLRKDR